MERELLRRMRCVWGLRRGIQSLCNVFLLASPPMQAWADALWSGQALHSMSAYQAGVLLSQHLPSDQAWGPCPGGHDAFALPDAHDIAGVPSVMCASSTMLAFSGSGLGLVRCKAPACCVVCLFASCLPVCVRGRKGGMQVKYDAAWVQGHGVDDSAVLK